MIKIIVTGASGSMGGRIIKMVHGMEGMRIVGVVEHEDRTLTGRDAGAYLNIGNLGVPISDNLAGCVLRGDVVIDFTDKETSLQHLKTASENGVAIIMGTTGFMIDEMDIVRTLSSRTRCVLVPDVSPLIYEGHEKSAEKIFRSFIRDTFAREAIAAAKWIVKQKKNGLYDMQDVLGLK
jgi:4-hydroxy-tetrahydrodipicolinate reductase